MIATMAKKGTKQANGSKNVRYITFSVPDIRRYADDLRSLASSLDALAERADRVRVAEFVNVDGGAKLQELKIAVKRCFGDMTGQVAAEELFDSRD